ncbi:MAG: DUF4258 domain-containing protein [Campylobacterota bacterium]|nr:DUF4258 domain-containing protein [Campylobacterota bacterium]
MTIKFIRKKVEDNNYFFSKHADDERKNDNLTILEIEEAIFSGQILENYSEDRRGKSCLVVGFTNDGKPIHIVCGTNSDTVVIITAYIPTPPKFKNPFERSYNE